MFEMVFMPAIIVSIVKLIVSFRPHLAISTTLGCMNLKQSNIAWETHFLNQDNCYLTLFALCTTETSLRIEILPSPYIPFPWSTSFDILE